MAEPHARGWRGDLIALGSLSGAWWLAVALVGPSGDFPTNDDWGYAPAVRALVEEGALRFTDWQSMPLLSHVLFGALFSLPAGFSHEALRASTLTAGWLGVLATYALLRELSAPRLFAAAGAAVLLVNPIYFGLAHTFMTDVPFTAALIAAAAAWLRAERTGRSRWYALATALCVWATLNRQLGVALPIAWTLVSALRHGLGRRWLTTALGPAAIVIGALVGYQRLVEATIGLPALYHFKHAELGQALDGIVRLRGLRLPLERAVVASLYLGLFTAPLAVLSFRSLSQDRWIRFVPLLSASAGVLAAGVGAAMPLLGNVLVDLGLGPRTAPGVVGGASPKLWILTTAAAGLGAGFLVVALHRGAWRSGVLGPARVRDWLARLWEGLRDRAPAEGPLRAWQWLLALATAVIAFAPTSLVYGAFFDRYLLTQLPFAVVLIWAATDPKGAPGRTPTAIAAAALAVSLGFSIAATHDHLAWQRARWEGVRALEARGVPRASIWGGFEVDNHPPAEGVTMVDRAKAPWAVALAPMAAYETIETIEVDAWLPYAVERVYLLHRDK